MPKIPLLDLHAQFLQIEPDVRRAIDRVFQTHRYIMGPEVSALETELSQYLHCANGIGVSSGSDALIMALMALNVGPGDEVITSPFTFFATVGAISRLGATPVFVDIDPKDFNINASAVESAISKKTKAMIPIHLFGQSADMTLLKKICQKTGVHLIEDAAQAIGAEHVGKRCGSFGDISCFSFFPSKNLGAIGDGGFVATQSADLAEKLRIIRNHGANPKYFHKCIGGNFRLDAIHAAVLREKLQYLDGWTQARQKHAMVYDDLFSSPELEEFVQPPWKRPGDRHIFNQYILRVKKRDQLREFLRKNEIETEIYYPVPMHLQECFSDLGHKSGAFPEAEKAAKEALAIPIYPELTQGQIEFVASSIQSFYRN